MNARTKAIEVLSYRLADAAIAFVSYGDFPSIDSAIDGVINGLDDNTQVDITLGTEGHGSWTRYDFQGFGDDDKLALRKQITAIVAAA